MGEGLSWEGPMGSFSVTYIIVLYAVLVLVFVIIYLHFPPSSNSLLKYERNDLGEGMGGLSNTFTGLSNSLLKYERHDFGEINF